MKNKIFLVLLLSVSAFVFSCNKVDFKRTKSGLLYKIIHAPNSKNNTPVKGGYTMKLFFEQKLNDSLLQSNYGKMPTYARVQDSVGNVYNPTEIFTMLRKGDSVVSVLLVDSLMAKGLMPQGMPPYMKKGDRINIYFKVVDVFTSDSLASLDSEKEMKAEMARQEKEAAEQKIKQDKELADWLAKKNITAQKAPGGTYVRIETPGTGPAVQSGKEITVKYTGRTLEDEKEFESNSYTFVVDAPQSAIEGWNDGLKLFRKGGKGTLYVPGVLAYGANPPMGSPFKPNAALIFDVEVTEVKDPAPGQGLPQINIDTTQRQR